MSLSFLQQAPNALIAGMGALIWIEPSAYAVVTAKDLTFEGSWLGAGCVVGFVIIALWLTCLGALRSDRRDRNRATANSADRGGPVYADIDGQMRVH